jgi:hypothetical protein
MVCSQNPENINVKTDDDALQKAPKWDIYRIWKNKEDIIQRIKEAKVLFNNKKQLLCSNNLSLEIKMKLIRVVFGVLLFVDQKHGP